jgi:hypothetical protein
MKPTGIIDYLFPNLLYILCFLTGFYLATHVHITITL